MKFRRSGSGGEKGQGTAVSRGLCVLITLHPLTPASPRLSPRTLNTLLVTFPLQRFPLLFLCRWNFINQDSSRISAKCFTKFSSYRQLPALTCVYAFSGGLHLVCTFPHLYSRWREKGFYLPSNSQPTSSLSHLRLSRHPSLTQPPPACHC